MFFKLLLSNIIMLLILDVSNPLENKAAHKNNIINKFCIKSIKSKLITRDTKNLDEISHFTCDCFVRKYNSGNSIKSSRIYCKEKASEKYNL